MVGANRQSRCEQPERKAILSSSGRTALRSPDEAAGHALRAALRLVLTFQKAFIFGLSLYWVC